MSVNSAGASRVAVRRFLILVISLEVGNGSVARGLARNRREGEHPCLRHRRPCGRGALESNREVPASTIAADMGQAKRVYLIRWSAPFMGRGIGGKQT
jgi:hypothetical protein